MARASYRAAVEWIALNDELGIHEREPDDPFGPGPYEDVIDEIAGLISVCLIADIFGKAPQAVAKAVLRVRQKEGLA